MVRLHVCFSGPHLATPPGKNNRKKQHASPGALGQLGGRCKELSGHCAATGSASQGVDSSGQQHMANTRRNHGHTRRYQTIPGHTSYLMSFSRMKPCRRRAHDLFIVHCDCVWSSRFFLSKPYQLVDPDQSGFEQLTLPILEQISDIMSMLCSLELVTNDPMFWTQFFKILYAEGVARLHRLPRPSFSRRDTKDFFKCCICCRLLEIISNLKSMMWRACCLTGTQLHRSRIPASDTVAGLEFKGHCWPWNKARKASLLMSPVVQCL